MLGLNINLAHAKTLKAPKCLAGFCLDTKLPTQNNLHSHFGGQKKREYQNDFSYCYKFVEKNKKISYGYFLFKDAAKRRLVTIRLSNAKICEGISTKVSNSILATEKGLHLGSSETDTLMLYGTPTYNLQPATEDLLLDFFGKNSSEKADKIYHYVDTTNAGYPSTRFYYLNNDVVGIELSVDE